MKNVIFKLPITVFPGCVSPYKHLIKMRNKTLNNAVRRKKFPIYLNNTALIYAFSIFSYDLLKEFFIKGFK